VTAATAAAAAACVQWSLKNKRKKKKKKMWRAARRTLFRCSTGRFHGETGKEQSRPTLAGHRRRKLLKLGEGPWFAIPYRTILEAPRDLRCSSRSAFETGSGKGWGVRMKVPHTHGYRTMRLKLKLHNHVRWCFDKADL
ncbi:unnamed protein product, partial [Ectocarpus sp. 12 AP-2014]